MSVQNLAAGTAGRRRRTGRPVALMVPALLLTAVLMIVPIVTTVIRVISDGGEGLVRLFAMPSIGPVFLNTLVWTLVSVAGAVLIGYLGALVLQSKHLRGVGLWRALVMVPWIIPGVVAATIWRWTLSTDYGILNQTLLDLGLIDAPVRWLSNPDIVLVAVALIQIWVTAPFVMLMVSAALAGIPEERYEAARLDGAGGATILWSIILPAIRTTTGICVLTLAIWALNSFTIIYVTTSGGPAGASTILPILLYQAFQNGDQTLVYAVALVQLVIGGVFAVMFARTMRTDLEEQS
ncbi:carbohydrate ABC transporter permease [Microbacterium marinilacus]|uniref:ABC transmembrane type-1 domain-containing protein n=1 Tax=Microbacterium marinilacus TaxID=415209 RepID=A0ABP7BSN7_9MICO|nr:sugar ABC transporter permease [Microbacterium marinilacus]MBY0689250.1 sugar ABC transporter permease [Microbacterium marinilacus]